MRLLHIFAPGILILISPRPRSHNRKSRRASSPALSSTPTPRLLPGVTVEVRNVDTNLTRTLVTEQDGRFSALQLPPGRYTVTFTLPGSRRWCRRTSLVTVGQTVPLNPTMKVSGISETVTVTTEPRSMTRRTRPPRARSNEITIEITPILGRKFEDLLTLTPGVSVVQGPDGDEITFSGQRGVFNNVSLDGGDYNNGFFGEQVGGQRAAIDITLEAVKEFQVIATGAAPNSATRPAASSTSSPSRARTRSMARSSTTSALEGLTSNTSDGKPLKDFHREQFGGTVGGPMVKDKAFYFLVVARRRNGLLNFMSNRGGELAHGLDAIGMRQLALRLAILPLTTGTLQGNGGLRSEVDK